MSEGSMLRGAWRGVVAAMAMTGMRRMEIGLNLIYRPPPEEIAEEALPELFTRIPPEHREEAIELAHWGYGAAGGIVYGSLPRSFRASRWAGPAYGLAIWALFEAGIAPMLGLRGPGERSASELFAIATDHVLYGLVVADRPRGD